MNIVEYCLLDFVFISAIAKSKNPGGTDQTFNLLLKLSELDLSMGLKA